MNWKGLGLVALLTIGACQPIDEHNWYENEVVTLDWTAANPATGYRPSEVDEFTLFYYPQDKSGTKSCQEFLCDKDVMSLPLETGRYDVLAISKDLSVQKDKYYRSAYVEFETELDSLQNRVIVSGGESMIYKGTLSDLTVQSDRKQSRRVILHRLLKKMTFIVNIFDYKELTQNVNIELSGIGSHMLLHDESVSADSEAILHTTIHKLGREAETDLGVHTTFKGTVYVLGVTGNNIMNLRFVDCRGVAKSMQLDITSYLKTWNTEEAVVYVNINSPQENANLERWNTINGDIIINNQDL